jgi:hypothetical protein
MPNCSWAPYRCRKKVWKKTEISQWAMKKIRTGSTEGLRRSGGWAHADACFYATCTGTGCQVGIVIVL